VVGLAIAGGTTPFGASVRRTATLYPGTQSRLWGTADAASVPGAAFVNGALSQALEYDDTHNESIVHISSPSVAAALALTDEKGGSGRDVMTAVAIGNEISSRAGSVTPGQFHKRGYHPSGLFAPFGTCYLAGWLGGCDSGQLTNAAGIVGSFAAGLIQCWVDGTQSKFLHPGWAAHSGIVAARLAQEGVTGPGEIFEGRFGLFASHLQSPGPEPDFGRLTRGLGTTWDSLNASFKPFPAAHVIHPYIDALLRLRERHGIVPEQVTRITCSVAPYIVGIVCEPLAEKRRPLTDSHGRVSLQYTSAEALALGRLGRDGYAPSSLRDPRILGLADRIDYVVDETLPGPEQFKGVVRVELTDGSLLEEVEEHNRGSAANPMSESEIVAKFRENVAGVLDEDAAARIVEAALALDRIEDARMLTKLTVPAHG
jgi:2-methylcitrate dehydratase PrpD